MKNTQQQQNQDENKKLVLVKNQQQGNAQTQPENSEVAQSAEKEKKVSEYYNLNTTGIAKITSTRKVTPKGGKTYMAATLLAMQGAPDNARTVRYSVRAVTKDAAAALETLHNLKAQGTKSESNNIRHNDVTASFVVGDVSPDTYTYKDKEGNERMASIVKGRLLGIGWARVDNEDVVGTSEGIPAHYAVTTTGVGYLNGFRVHTDDNGKQHEVADIVLLSGKRSDPQRVRVSAYIGRETKESIESLRQAVNDKRKVYLSCTLSGGKAENRTYRHNDEERLDCHLRAKLASINFAAVDGEAVIETKRREVQSSDTEN
jgi:hypothetical protein